LSFEDEGLDPGSLIDEEDPLFHDGDDELRGDSIDYEEV
jgi:hypothetical protein